MAHFAEIDDNNIVLRVIVVDNRVCLNARGEESEMLGATFCQSLFGGNWKQTSYNGNMRKNYAGIGFKYDLARDAFIPPQPFASWDLNEATCQWEAPVAYPTDGNRYDWDEANKVWVLV